MATTVRYSIREAFLEGLHGPMRYWQSAPGAGPPIVLVHGYGGLIEHWRAVMRPLAQMRRLYALDLYGFGRSAIPSVPPSRQLWADQLAEFVSAVCGEPAIIVGHSMGGMVSAQFAISYPHLVAGLVLVDSTGVNDPTAQPSAFEQLLYGLIRATPLGDLAATFAANPIAVRQGLLAAYHRQARVDEAFVKTFLAPLQRRGGPQWYLAASRAFPKLFLEAKVGAVSAPALLIWGEFDRSIPPSIGEAIQRQLLPQAELKIMRETGHCPFDEDPAIFVALIRAWLAHESLA